MSLANKADAEWNNEQLSASVFVEQELALMEDLWVDLSRCQAGVDAGAEQSLAWAEAKFRLRDRFR